MRPRDIDFNLLYQMVFSVPDYMNISSIEFEPTIRINFSSDLNIIKEVEWEQSNFELQRLIKRAETLEQANKITDGKKELASKRS